MLALMCVTILVISVASGKEKNIKKNLETVTGQNSVDSLQKTAILGTSHILQSENLSRSCGDHRLFMKKNAWKNMPVTKGKG
jgi:hypothetical protein